MTQDERKTVSKLWYVRTGFTGGVLVMFGLAYWRAQQYSRGVELLPTYVSGTGILLASLLLIRDWFRRYAGVSEAADALSGSHSLFVTDSSGTRMNGGGGLLRVGRSFGWVWLFVALMALMGALPAVPVFVSLCLHWEGRRKWSVSIAVGVATVAVLWLLEALLGLGFPRRLI